MYVNMCIYICVCMYVGRYTVIAKGSDGECLQSEDPNPVNLALLWLLLLELNDW